jgi:hypothetical protein
MKKQATVFPETSKAIEGARKDDGDAVGKEEHGL